MPLFPSARVFAFCLPWTSAPCILFLRTEFVALRSRLLTCSGAAAVGSVSEAVVGKTIEGQTR